MCVPGRYRRRINAPRALRQGFEGKASSSAKSTSKKRKEEEGDAREREKETVVLNFAFVPAFAWCNSFVLVSYLASFLVARSVISWLQICAVDVGNLTFNVPPHEYQIATGTGVDSALFMAHGAELFVARVAAPLSAKLFFHDARRQPSTITFSSTIRFTNTSRCRCRDRVAESSIVFLQIPRSLRSEFGNRFRKIWDEGRGIKGFTM